MNPCVEMFNNTPTSRQALTNTDEHHMAAAVGLATCALLAIVFNSFLITAFIYNRLLRTKPTNYLLINLAGANILVCVNAIPMRILHLLGSRVISCKITGCFTIADCSGAVLTLTALSIDRYIGVNWPLIYSSIVTPPRVTLTICLIWLVSVIIGFLPCIGWGALPGNKTNLCKFSRIFNPEYTLFVFMTTVFLPLMTIVFSYTKIYFEVKRHLRQIHSVCVPHELAQETSQPNTRGEETKAAKTIAIILGAYMICQTPISLVDLTGICGVDVPASLTMCAVFLAYCNALLSPLVCARVHREFKETLYWLIVTKICHYRPGDSPSN